MSDRLHLLIVDDDEDLTDILASRFQRLGLAVTSCHDTVSCLDAIESAAMNVALLDGNLAGSDGLQLVSALRELQPDLPIIMFSGNVEQHFIESAYGAGVVKYLFKPCSLAELQSAVFDVLGQQAHGDGSAFGNAGGGLVTK